MKNVKIWTLICILIMTINLMTFAENEEPKIKHLQTNIYQVQNARETIYAPNGDFLDYWVPAL